MVWPWVPFPRPPPSPPLAAPPVPAPKAPRPITPIAPALMALMPITPCTILVMRMSSPSISFLYEKDTTALLGSMVKYNLCGLNETPHLPVCSDLNLQAHLNIQQVLVFQEK